MRKLVGIGLFMLSAVAALAQSPPRLNFYTSPDGEFQFVYADDAEFDLLVGERIARATQSRNGGFPVCNYPAALVCVVYPMNRFVDTSLEGAGFSVNRTEAVSESDCLDFTDHLDTIMIGGREFRHAFSKSRAYEHSQSVHQYRNFHGTNCYELRMAVSQSDASADSPGSNRRALTPAEAEKVREPLRLMLSTFNFLK